MFQSGQQIGTYILIQRLGRGGFGEVWLAERKSKFVTTKVAVKLPLEEQVDADAIKQEATLWEQASGHSNVLPIIDADEYDGQVVIVSEYAPNGSLEDLLKKKGDSLPMKQAVEMAIGVLSGLEFLHSRRIIHRDIKPANILLQGDTPRLADFGISRVMKTNSLSANLTGTPYYMAPEAFDRKRNVQTDIWSIGVVLYQMLKGELPFSADNITDLLGAIIQGEPEPLPDSVPPQLQRIVMKALAKESAKRYQTSREMRQDLADFLIRISQKDIQLTQAAIPVDSPSAIKTLKIPEVPRTGEPKIDFDEQPEYAANLPEIEPKKSPSYLKILIPVTILLLIGSIIGGYFMFRGDNGEQVQLIPFYKRDKFGFKNNKNEFVIKPIYDLVTPFSEGLAMVNYEKSWKYIDNTGKDVITLSSSYYGTQPFREGMAEVVRLKNIDEVTAQKNQMSPSGNTTTMSGFIDKTGKEVIPLKYNKTNGFSEGLASVERNGKSGFINTSGNEVIALKYEIAGSFKEGLAPVSLNKKWGFIDKDGNEIVPLRYDLAGVFSDGLAVVKLDNKWGYVDKTGNEVIPLTYNSAFGFSEGVALVNDEIFINKINQQLSSISEHRGEGYPIIFSEGILIMEVPSEPSKKKPKTYFFIGKTGKRLNSNYYNSATKFTDGFAFVTNESKGFFVGKDGKEYYDIY